MKRKGQIIFALCLLMVVMVVIPITNVFAEDTVQPIETPNTSDIFFYILLGVLALATVIIISLFIANKKFKLKDTGIKDRAKKEEYTIVTLTEENFNDPVLEEEEDEETI